LWQLPLDGYELSKAMTRTYQNVRSVRQRRDRAGLDRGIEAFPVTKPPASCAAAPGLRLESSAYSFPARLSVASASVRSGQVCVQWEPFSNICFEATSMMVNRVPDRRERQAT
jgi:hypothetical protein